MTTRQSHLHPAADVVQTAALGAASRWTNAITHLLDGLLCWYVKRLERRAVAFERHRSCAC